MREYTAPSLASTNEYQNVTDLIRHKARQAPNTPAFDVRDQGQWREVTIAEFESTVIRVAKALIADGVGQGDSVAVMADTSYAWAVIESAIWYAGGVVVPIYPTSAEPQVVAMLADTDAVAALAGSAEQHAALTRAGQGKSDAPWIAHLSDYIAAAETRIADVSTAEVESRRIAASKNDVATIVYTSGTTQAPKGVILTHNNLLSQVLNIAAAYSDVIREGGRTVIFLPLAHVLARGLQLVCVANGMKVAHVSDPKHAISSLAQLKPTFLVVVPRVLQKIAARVESTAKSAKIGWLWKLAVKSAVSRARALEEGSRSQENALTRGLKRAKFALFDVLFFKRIRTMFGGKLAYILSGAAALDPQLCRLFTGIGLTTIEGYGLTETTAPLTANPARKPKPGTVGVVVPGNSVVISDDGEILAAGAGVTPGYRNPQHSEHAFVNGYFRTGDLGSIDDEGYLTITGRLKDVIVTSGGKTVSPAQWETALETHPLIAHAVAVGDGKPYLSSIIVMEPETLQAWATSQGAPDIEAALSSPLKRVLTIENPRLRSVVQAAIDTANKQLSRSEQIRKFELVIADLSVAGGNVTATMKLKRDAFLRAARAVIDKLYSDRERV